MHRRDSIMNGGEAQQQSVSTANELGVAEYLRTSTVEEFDATAVALSRLSVLAGSNPADGNASPQPDNSTYETTTPSNCPSPSKRTSEFFERAVESSDLKRLRRDSPDSQTFAASPFSKDFSLEASRTTTPSHTTIVGLGLQVDDSLLTSTTSAEAIVMDEDDCLSTSGTHIEEVVADNLHAQSSCTSSIASLRQRALSLPATPSTRWLASPAQKRHHQQQHKNIHKLKSMFSSASTEQRRKTPTHRRPPITQQTLRELELSEIFKNAQLRHDIVHDPNLQFRPNTDGERGAKKREEADKYWRAIAVDLANVQQMSRSKLASSRLWFMFEEMKNILLSLVPLSEKAQLYATFDHEMFMQSLHHGLFSASRFAKYMSSLMKRHCAPMRDDSIDATVLMLEEAQCNEDFVDALRATFDVLEMMKLDVANHQLRSLRGFLLESSVDFEKSWFVRKYGNKALSQDSSKSWYNTLLTGGAVKPDYRAAFTNGLVGFLKTGCDLQIPATFTFDQARLAALRKDLRDLVSLNIILLLAKQVKKNSTVDELAILKADLWILASAVRSRSADRWTAALSDIALHISSQGLGRDAHGLPILPAAKDRRSAEAWLEKHLSPSSPIFVMVETRAIALLNATTYNSLTFTTLNGHSTTPAPDFGILDCCKDEVSSITRRLNAVADFHWKVHGANYIEWSKQ